MRCSFCRVPAQVFPERIEARKGHLVTTDDADGILIGSHPLAHARSYEGSAWGSGAGKTALAPVPIFDSKKHAPCCYSPPDAFFLPASLPHAAPSFYRPS